MTQTRASGKDRCPNCRLNNNLCLCSIIIPFEITTNISLIVHVNELKLTSNSAQFIQKLLPTNAETFIRGQVYNTFESTGIVKREGRPIFLYPHDDALELNDDFKESFPGPYHIIIPDGNWHQARRVRKREAAFKEMVAVKLPDGLLGEYKLRRALQPEWLSTFEAVAHTLGIIEGPEITEKLMKFFRVWVKTTMYNRSKDDTWLKD